MQQQQAMWPYASRSEALEAFETCAGLVQTRSFHMSKTNHMTGVSEDGECLSLSICHTLPGIETGGDVLHMSVNMSFLDACWWLSPKSF